MVVELLLVLTTWDMMSHRCQLQPVSLEGLSVTHKGQFLCFCEVLSITTINHRDEIKGNYFPLSPLDCYFDQTRHLYIL